MSFRILSLDGGGIRGLLTCKLLESLEKANPGFLSKVDLFAGTSTGGILALGLANGLSPADMAKIYEENGSKIFAKTTLDKYDLIDRFLHADYDNKILEAVLRDKFGNKKLGDLKKNVLISSFQMDNSKSKSYKDFRSWKPKFFHNFKKGAVNMDCYEEVVHVALHTSAAPTFFPLHQGYADGGVVANNPSMCALAQALDPSTGGQTLGNIKLLSVGTGVLPKWAEGYNENWGFKQWAPYLITIMMDGVSGVADYQCKQLLGANNYHRLNLCFDKDISLDNVQEIPYMASLVVPKMVNGKPIDAPEIQAAKAWVKDRFLQ